MPAFINMYSSRSSSFHPLGIATMVGKAVKEEETPKAFVRICFYCTPVAKKGRLLQSDELSGFIRFFQEAEVFLS